MCSFIKVVETAERNPFVAYQGHLETFLLPAETVVYHGTDRHQSEWNPAEQEIWSPAWFGLSLAAAEQDANFRGSSQNGRPLIYEFKAKASLRLLEASDGPISALLDELYYDYTPDDIAEFVLELGYEGWHIRDTVIMIGYTDLLTFVRAFQPAK